MSLKPFNTIESHDEPQFEGSEASAEWNLPMSIIWNLYKLNPIDL